MKPSILLLIAAALFTQREFAQEVTFKTETKLVIVNVSVKGKDGKPLTSLKKEDIEIFEDGVKQSLAVFELEQLSNDVLPPVPDTPAAPVTLEERVQAPVGQAVTTASNAPPIRHQDKRILRLEGKTQPLIAGQRAALIAASETLTAIHILFCRHQRAAGKLAVRAQQDAEGAGRRIGKRRTDPQPGEIPCAVGARMGRRGREREA